MFLNHPETVYPHPHPWKNCLPQNQSLVLKRLGTSALDGIHSKASDHFVSWYGSFFCVCFHEDEMFKVCYVLERRPALQLSTNRPHSAGRCQGWGRLGMEAARALGAQDESQTREREVLGWAAEPLLCPRW